MNMKRFILLICIGAGLLAIPSCKKDKTEPEEALPTSFAKKNLVEKFSSQYCGYCPYGMDCIHEYIADDPNWIPIVHHYGFAADHFSVAGCKTITEQLKVSGTPSIAINRHTTNYKSGSNIVFHPAYLATTDRAQFDKTTYASVEIANTFYPSNRQLEIEVSGIVGLDNPPQLKLTVLVKESGMIDTQRDYYETEAGWEQYRHTHAVRIYATAATGDVVTVTNHRYQAHYTLSLSKSWVPENCMVVAFLSEDFQPVVQVAQEPVVKGTKGGADIVHGGIKAYPTSD